MIPESVLPSYDEADLPENVRVWIYGTGARGRSARARIASLRPDVTVEGYLDSFQEGMVDGLPVRLPERLIRDWDFGLVLIASTFMSVMYVHLHGLGFPMGSVAAYAIDEDFTPRSAMVSRDHGFMYVPVTKVAHTSFRRAFAPYCPQGAENVDLRSPEWNGLYKFAFVRNPFDRLVSCYAKQRKSKYQALLRVVLGESHGFGDFVRFVAGMKDGASDPHWASQSLTLCDGQDNVLVDDVFRFEDIPSALETLRRSRGIEVDMPWHNASRRAAYADYYGPEERDIVARRYGRDLSAFGYRFD